MSLIDEVKCEIGQKCLVNPNFIYRWYTAPPTVRSCLLLNSSESICVQNISNGETPNQTWLCNVKADVPSPKSLNTIWLVSRVQECCFTMCLILLCWSSCGSCSVSSFSCGWLITPPHHHHTLLSLSQSPSSALNQYSSSDSPESQGEKDDPPDTHHHRFSPLHSVSFLKNNRCSGACRRLSVWWEASPSPPVTSYCYFTPLLPNIQSVTSLSAFTLSLHTLHPLSADPSASSLCVHLGKSSTNLVSNIAPPCWIPSTLQPECINSTAFLTSLLLLSSLSASCMRLVASHSPIFDHMTTFHMLFVLCSVYWLSWVLCRVQTSHGLPYLTQILLLKECHLSK